MGDTKSRIWAITSFFNPVEYQRKISNYRVFRAKLAIPLVAVELGYGGAFELGHEDADILVQLRGSDVLWQKESLLSVALQHLPAECEYVVSIDSDVIFDSPDWFERTKQELEQSVLVQPFATVYDLGLGDDLEKPEFWRHHGAQSLASAVATMSVDEAFRVRPRGPDQRTAAVAGLRWHSAVHCSSKQDFIAVEFWGKRSSDGMCRLWPV